MRKFLLWIATMCVGGPTIVTALTVFSGDGSALLGAVLLWVFALVLGVLVSAPAFLDPPDGGGVWYFRVPLGLWLFLMMLKVISWVGFQVLSLVWMLIFLLWQNRNTGRRPSFSGAGSGAAPDPVRAPVATAMPQRRASTPPAWHSDPTGRYTHRYWDGTRWTHLVANGAVQAVDPL
ncbi:DUF2510 domain-containing protein [Catenuloplanes indicus]|uniref:Magnesium-transporting ATPase (P-type) n=1 Tax=Catenuloplanes indicus TaxID=137267 RepID=A0AAE3VVD3_9ACTN|nr:DUF2510 domain-containing protein [Catenuloplanes indicus]MDQ0364948.1 magnesium-transporting ATPase (P-type) [Catenuloplanes indicus]